MDPADLRFAANEWIKEFSFALKNASLYSLDHPRGRDSLSRSFEKLKILLKGRPAVTLARAEGRLLLENAPLDRDRVISGQIYADLNARGVTTIDIAAGITVEEYQALIRSLLLKPERIHERGGLDQVLLDEGVSAVSINKARVGKVPETLDLLTDLSLMDLLAGRAGALGGESLSDLMAKDPVGLARVLGEAAARRDMSPSATNFELQSEQMAEMLERVAERAIDEKKRERFEILADVARILAHSRPELQGRIILEKTGPRSPRRNLTAAVDGMPPDVLADLISVRHASSGGDLEGLHEILMRVLAWKESREATVGALRGRLRSGGASEEETREVVDHLMWAELDVSRRLQLLYQRDYLLRVDFQRVKEVLVKLFGTDQLKEATTLIQKYLSGLLVEDTAVRRRVAENARYILHLIEKTGKGVPMLGRIGDLFVARVQDERDEEVHSRLAAALAFLADLRLRNSELGAVLDLQRRAEALASSADASVRDRGERLCQALSRVGNEKLFKDLTDRHLEGTDSASVEAAEVLKRAGTRAANYLIDRLAEEEDRSNRARLVTLLKDMNRSSSQPFTARLADSRWYLVRNVVHILGEIGDASVIPALKEIVRHGDPRVRKELVRTFMRLGTAEAEDLIIEALADPDRAVQAAAVNALSGLHGRRSEGIVLEILRKAGPYADVDPEVRQEAIAVSGRIGLREAVGSLVDIVTRKGFLGYAEPTEMRVAAIQALGVIGDEAGLGAVRAAARGDGKREVRESAATALAARGIQAPEE